MSLPVCCPLCGVAMVTSRVLKNWLCMNKDCIYCCSDLLVDDCPSSVLEAPLFNELDPDTWLF